MSIVAISTSCPSRSLSFISLCAHSSTAADDMIVR